MSKIIIPITVFILGNVMGIFLYWLTGNEIQRGMHFAYAVGCTWFISAIISLLALGAIFDYERCNK